MEAVEIIWEAKQELDKSMFAIEISKTLNWEKIGDNDPPNEGIASLLEVMPTSFELKKFSQEKGFFSQLYCDPMIWAYFCTYKAIIVDTVSRLIFLEKKLPLNLLKKDSVAALVKKTILEHSGVIEKFGASSFPSLLEAISDQMMQRSRDFINGKEIDQAAIKKADEIIKAANLIQQNELSNTLTPPK